MRPPSVAAGHTTAVARRRTRVPRLVRIAAGSLLLTSLAFALVLSRLAARPLRASFEETELRAADWQVDADVGCALRVSSLLPRDGAQSLRIDAPRDARCELVPRLYPAFADMFLREPFATDRWYRFSIFVQSLDDDTAPTSLADNTMLAQWHSSPDPLVPTESGRGPPLGLRIHDGRWGITYGWDSSFLSGTTPDHWEWVGPVERGRWTDWEFHLKWSHRDDGVTEVWRDGALVFERRGPNTYNDLRGVYLKLGLYHPTSDSTIYLDRVSVTDD